MRPLHFLFPTLLMVAGCGPCSDPGFEQQQTQFYKQKNFTRLSISDGLEVDVVHGEMLSIQATGESNAVDDLVLTVADGTLEMHHKEFSSGNRHIRIRIVMPALDAVDLSGGANLRAVGFSGSVFDASLTGGSVGNFKMNVGVIHTKLNGASKAVFIGKGSGIDAFVTGGSSLHALDYSVSTATLMVTDASWVKLSANAFLNVHASATSDVIYLGSPVIESDLSEESAIHRE